LLLLALAPAGRHPSPRLEGDRAGNAHDLRLTRRRPSPAAEPTRTAGA
jgi:hypothetical protein